jgi:predicted nucleic acid-binding protein
MKAFVDTAYLIAILNPDDELAESAATAHRKLGADGLVTTEEVLTEFLNAVAGAGPWARIRAHEMVIRVLSSPKIEVQVQSHESFLQGLDLYSQRRDKGYSLTDCISMSTMRRLQIRQILTADRHFHQEGFAILL